MFDLFAFLRRKKGPRTARQQTGWRAEREAERYLNRRGCRTVARNVRYSRGEVDLVVLEKGTGTLCFVEVRSRTVADDGATVVEPEETVTLAKRRRVIAAAKQFLAERRATDRPIRFDVVTVRYDASGRRRPDVRHYAGAFDAGGRLT